jgi:hypothetical protein
MIIGAIIPKLAGIERRNATAHVLAAARAVGHSRWCAFTLVRIAECLSEEERPALVSEAFTDKCESRPDSPVNQDESPVRLSLL